jgi:hypothetical protein
MTFFLSSRPVIVAFFSEISVPTSPSCPLEFKHLLKSLQLQKNGFTTTMTSKEQLLEELHDQWRLEVKLRGRDPAIYQKRFETLEGIAEFRLVQIGAALKIQTAFRRWPKRRKLRWRRKYHRFIAKLIGQKKLYRAIMKSRCIEPVFLEKDFEDRMKVKIASAIVISRIIRGFLGERRFKRILKEKLDDTEAREQATLKLQSFARRIIIWQKYPGVGLRYRLYQRKKVLFYRSKPIKSFQGVISVQNEDNEKESLEKETDLKTLAMGKTNRVIEMKGGSPKATEDHSPHDYTPHTMEHENDEIHSTQFIPVNYPSDFNPTLRRLSFIFPHLKLCNNINFLGSKCLKIQCAYRIYKAKQVFYGKKEIKQLHSILILQKWFRSTIHRHKFYNLVVFASSLWKDMLEDKVRKRKAIILIQAKIRQFFKRKWFISFLNIRNIYKQKVRKWFYYRYCLYKIRQRLRLKRSYYEVCNAGAYIYSLTERRWLVHYTHEGAKKIKNIEKSNHELQKIFVSHSLSIGIDVAKVIKLMKDCKGLCNESSFTLSTVELQFMKIKHSNEKRIDYPTFLDLLGNLMIFKEFNIDPPKTLWEMNDDDVLYVMKKSNFLGKKKDSDDAETAVNQDSMTVKQLKSFTYGNCKGKWGFIMKFILTYLTTTSDYNKVVEFLGSKSASGQASTLLASTIRLIQQFIKNRLAIAHCNQSLKVYQVVKAERRRNKAAIMIQKMIKSFLGYRFITKIAQNIYCKFVDGESEREYWFNPRTGQSFWTKPHLLGKYDCGIAIRMPSELEKFSVPCAVCEKNYSTAYCKDCALVYCTSCYSSSHRGTGSRAHHSYLHIDNCIQCEFQVGTKYCLSCQDLYCDSCYGYMHKKGRLRFHSCDKYSDSCDFCHNLTAQYKEIAYKVSRSSRNNSMKTGNNNIMTSSIVCNSFYCNKCYFEEYAILPAERIIRLKQTKTGTYNNNARRLHSIKLQKIEYYGRKVTLYREKIAEEQKKKEIQATYERHQLELHKQKELEAIQFIQRVYRGYYIRQRIKDFIHERKDFLILREQENKLRNSLLTSLLNMIGFTQVFDSDTPLEKVHKLYPWYMHHIVAECIESKWNDACQMLLEHNDYLKNKPKSSFLQYIQVKIHLYFVKKAYEKSCNIYDAKVIMVNNANENYYNVRHSLTVSLFFSSFLRLFYFRPN